MRFTGELRRIGLDLTKYRKTLDRHLRNEIEEAARQWLRAVLIHIPIWSGASVATFHRLASQVQMSDRTRVPPKDGVKSRADLGESRSEGEFKTDGDFYRFEYATTLRHLVYNEFNNANSVPDPGLFAQLINPGPYRFQAAGQVAFREYARTVRLPAPRIVGRRRRRI